MQTILCIAGNFIFVNRANPFALLLVTGALVYTSAQMLKDRSVVKVVTDKPWLPFVYGILGVVALSFCQGSLYRIFNMYPDPGAKSDVIPQLKGQADLFFSGQFPYVPIETVSHKPYPVYMPLQWMPYQLSNIFSTDPRMPSYIMLALGIFVAGYFLRKHHAFASIKHTLPAMFLFAVPMWAFVRWSKLDVIVSGEGVVAFWYILLATGLAIRNFWLITIGVIGCVLSRYSLLFWLPLMALLLWLYEDKKYSFIIWGSTVVAVIALFIVPFLMKDPTILSKMSTHYADCDESSWVYPDEYTYKEGISLNIHLREWMPGNPEDSLPYAHWPQFLVQIFCVAGAFAYYKKFGHRHYDIYTYALIWLAIMPMLLYIFSPMVFRYYMLMPLSVSAVLCWKAIAFNSVQKGSVTD